jgi:hypothetical protein
MILAQAWRLRRRHNQQAGMLNVLLIPLVLVIVVLLAIGGMAYYYYGQYQDYKNNTDQKVAVAVTKAKQQTSDEKDKAFAEKLKSPYTIYNGPEEFGSLRIQYPRTWSAYVDAPSGQTNRPINGYFAPAQVPSINDRNNSFALRVYVVQQPYDQLLKPYQQKQQRGLATIQPYQSPNIPNIVGVRIDGEVQQDKQGAMIILPFRDKTLEMWTESKDYKNDFDTIILPNFSLVP